MVRTRSTSAGRAPLSVAHPLPLTSPLLPLLTSQPVWPLTL